MSWNPFKAVDRAVDRALDKGSNVLHNARNEFKDATRAVRRTASSAVNTARREFKETTQAAKKTTNRAVNIARREVGETSQAVRRTTNNFANIARREFKETTQAAKRTTNRAVNIARREVGETSQAVRRTTNNFANIARREFKETTQAAKRTTNRAVNIARREVGETSQAVRRTTNNVANIARREFKETTQAAKRTTNRAVNIARREVGETSQALSRTARNVANTARRVNLSDVGHTVLDGAGFIPVVGGVADLANAGWYAAKGDKVNAALSAASAIPFAGDAFAAGKLATKGAKLVKDAKGGRTFITYTLRDGDGAVRYVGRASGKGSPEAVLDRRINGWRGHHILRKHPELDPRNARLDAVQGNKAANQGAEDVLYSRHQVKLEPGERLIVSKREPVAKLKPEPGETLPVKARELAGGANTNQGARPLLNRTNPQSNEPRKVRNPFLNQGRYSTPRPDGKMSVFEKIEAYARDLKQP